jgi:hypothetical protein
MSVRGQTKKRLGVYLCWRFSRWLPACGNPVLPLIKASDMTASLTDFLLTPIERLRCSRCGARMNLTSIEPRPERSEKRIFECAKCNFASTTIVSDPLTSEESNRLANNIRPPA